MITYEAVLHSLASDRVPASTEDIELAELEPGRRIGTGRGGDSAYILVGPGQARAPQLSGAHFAFQPWTSLIDHRTSQALDDVCVLRFWSDDPNVLSGVAAVFSGLVDLTWGTPESLGTAIEGMQALGQRFDLTVTRDGDGYRIVSDGPVVRVIG